MRRLSRSVVLVLVLAGFSLTTAPRASALSCVAPDSLIKNAEYLVTGQVTAIDPDMERIEITVGEVWRGSDIPESLRLHDDLPFWSDWKVGREYLLAPKKAKDGFFKVNACTAWSNSLRFSEYRPAVVRQPGAVPTPLVETPEPVEALSNDELRLRKLGAGLAVIVVLGGGIILLRRKRGTAAPGQGYSPETRPEDY